MAKASAKDLKLVATRVPVEVWRVIHLAMVMDGETSEAAFLRPRVQELADRLLEEEPELRDMLRAIKENEARRAAASDKPGADPKASSASHDTA